jgi:hypothetical protein
MPLLQSGTSQGTQLVCPWWLSEHKLCPCEPGPWASHSHIAAYVLSWGLQFPPNSNNCFWFSSHFITYDPTASSTQTYSWSVQVVAVLLLLSILLHLQLHQSHVSVIYILVRSIAKVTPHIHYMLNICAVHMEYILQIGRLLCALILITGKKFCAWLKNFSGLETLLQLVEHLPSKHKALNSNPSTTRKRKRTKNFSHILLIYWQSFCHKINVIIDKWGDRIKTKFLVYFSFSFSLYIIIKMFLLTKT